MSAKLEEVLHALHDVKSKVNDKLLSIKREMESADDCLVKRMRLDTKPTFKKRGHEKQHHASSTSKYGIRSMRLPPHWNRLLPPWRRLALASRKVRR